MRVRKLVALTGFLAACSGGTPEPGAQNPAQDAGGGAPGLPDASEAGLDGDTADVAQDDSLEAASEPDAQEGGDSAADVLAEDAATGESLAAGRDRLLGTYFDYLKANPGSSQSNGLSGSNVTSVCDVWDKLDPSAQSVFLTITARLHGGILGVDGSSMLSHVAKLYRVVGGDGATASSAGSCGGAEANRMILSMDGVLHASLRAAHANAGSTGGNGKRDISDVIASSYWRNSHDLAGPHQPFDESDETEGGEPRGQVQYFADPLSTLANSALGRADLLTLVDPYALEMDQDYDCTHNSNPMCEYVFYGPTCLPQPKKPGTAMYVDSYGAFEPGWIPQGCPTSFAQRRTRRCVDVAGSHLALLDRSRSSRSGPGPEIVRGFALEHALQSTRTCCAFD